MGLFYILDDNFQYVFLTIPYCLIIAWQQTNVTAEGSSGNEETRKYFKDFLANSGLIETGKTSCYFAAFPVFHRIGTFLGFKDRQY